MKAFISTNISQLIIESKNMYEIEKINKKKIKLTKLLELRKRKN